MTTFNVSGLNDWKKSGGVGEINSSIACTTDSVLFGYTGTTYQLVIRNQNSTNVTSLCTFSSATPAKVTVSSTGLLTAVAGGSSVITITRAEPGIQPLTDTMTAYLSSSLTVTPTSITFATTGDTEQLLVVDNNALDLTNLVTYASTDEGVATVSSEGLVTSVASGTCDIEVTYGSCAKKTSAITVE